MDNLKSVLQNNNEPGSTTIATDKYMGDKDELELLQDRVKAYFIAQDLSTIMQYTFFDDYDLTNLNDFILRMFEARYMSPVWSAILRESLNEPENNRKVQAMINDSVVELATIAMSMEVLFPEINESALSVARNFLFAYGEFLLSIRSFQGIGNSLLSDCCLKQQQTDVIRETNYPKLVSYPAIQTPLDVLRELYDTFKKCGLLYLMEDSLIKETL